MSEYKFKKGMPLTKEDTHEMSFFQKLVKNASDNCVMHYDIGENIYIVRAELQEHRYKELIAALDERGYDYTVEECFL